MHVVHSANVLHCFLLKDVHVRLNGANYSYDLDEHVEHSYTSHTEQVRYELVTGACCAQSFDFLCVLLFFRVTVLLKTQEPNYLSPTFLLLY